MLKTFLGKISTLIETLNNNNEKNIIWIISILFQQNTNYPNKTKLSQQRVSLHYADLRALKKLPYPKFSCKCSHLQDLVEVKVKKKTVSGNHVVINPVSGDPCWFFYNLGCANNDLGLFFQSPGDFRSVVIHI